MSPWKTAVTRVGITFGCDIAGSRFPQRLKAGVDLRQLTAQCVRENQDLSDTVEQSCWFQAAEQRKNAARGASPRVKVGT